MQGDLSGGVRVGGGREDTGDQQETRHNPNVGAQPAKHNGRAYTVM